MLTMLSYDVRIQKRAKVPTNFMVSKDSKNTTYKDIRLLRTISITFWACTDVEDDNNIITIIAIVSADDIVFVVVVILLVCMFKIAFFRFR